MRRFSFFFYWLREASAAASASFARVRGDMPERCSLVATGVSSFACSSSGLKLPEESLASSSSYRPVDSGAFPLNRFLKKKLVRS